MTRTPVIVLALLAALAGCSSSDAGQAPEPATSTAGASTSAGAAVVPGEEARDLVDVGAVLVDVRNPDEYAGHVEGAQSIPLESGDFDAGVEGLARDTTYVVYCASGRRAGIAVERMTQLGFTDVHNAGGLEDVADVVGPVVTGG